MTPPASPAPWSQDTLERLASHAASLLGAPGAVAAFTDPDGTVVSAVVAPAGATVDPAWVRRLVQRDGGPVVIADLGADPRVPSEVAAVAASVLALPVPSPAGSHRPDGVVGVFDVAAREWTEDEQEALATVVDAALTELRLNRITAEYAEDRVAWELAVGAAGVGAFDWDLTTGDLRWDDRLFELFGVDESTFGRSIEAFNDLVHPEDRSRVGHALQHAIDTVGEYAAEYRVVRPDGAVRWVAARGRALPGPDGVSARVLGAAYDTTAAVEADVRVGRVLEAMPTAFVQLDAAWRFTYVNSEAERLLGIGRDDLLGGDVWDLFPALAGSDFETHYRRAMATGEPEAFDAYYPPPLDAWYEVRAWPSPDGLSVYFVDVTERHAAARRTSILATVGDELASTLNAEVAVGRLAAVLVPELADWCVISLVEEGPAGDWRRTIRDVGWWHADPERRRLVDRYTEVRIPALLDTSYVARALADGEPLVVQAGAAEAVAEVLEPGEARDLALELAPAAVAIVPLLGRGRVVGLMTAFRDERGFADDDLAVLLDVATRAGLALDNAMLFKQQRDLAEGLQRSLLTAPPEPDHLHVVVRYTPAAQVAQVGGDWYDAFLQRDGATVLVIGDVVGHDAAAAAAMGQIRGVLRGIAAHTGESPSQVLRGVDRLVETLDLDTTATAVVARFEQTDEDRAAGLRRLRWSTAGHPPPIVVLPDGAVRFADPGLEATDLLLGLDPGAERREHVMALPGDSVVVLYTDGLVERRGEDLDTGFSRLAAVLGELAAQDLPIDELCDRLLERMVPERPEDDVALVAVKLHREDRPRPAGTYDAERNVALHRP